MLGRKTPEKNKVENKKGENAMSKIKFVIISPRQRNSGGGVFFYEFC